MSNLVTAIEGDGIGREIFRSVVDILAAAGADITWDLQYAGESAIPHFGTPLPAVTLESIKRNKVALKGPTTTPIGKGHRSINVALRKELDLYANVRPIKSIEGVSKNQNIDFVIVRENTEDLYSGIEFKVSEDIAQAIKIISRSATKRLAEYGCMYAAAKQRKTITCVHKANIMKETDGLFLNTVRDVVKGHTRLQFNDLIVDNACMQLVMRPEKQDVIVTENLYGDILSDLGAGLIGGLGVAAGANMGDQYAVFEAVHGSAPDIAGQGIANPTALLLSAIMMLDHLGMVAVSRKVDRAVKKTLLNPETRTADLGGRLNTQQFTEAVIKNLNYSCMY